MNLPSPPSETPLLIWLLGALRPMNRTRVKQLLRSGRVLVNATPVTRHDLLVKPEDRLAIARDGAVPTRADSNHGEVSVLYRDDAVIALDKPEGLLTVATEAEKLDTAFVRLNAHLADRKAGRAFAVHRLDRETSGVLLFARSAEVRDKLQAAWEQVAKTYLAVVDGRPEPPTGTVENFLIEGKDLRVRPTKKNSGDAKRAVTDYRVLAAKGNLSLVQVELKTGRKHQIRVHLTGLGCPVIGDRVYASNVNPAGRLGLHAWRLAFDHPVTGERIRLEAPYPTRLSRVIAVPETQAK